MRCIRQYAMLNKVQLFRHQTTISRNKRIDRVYIIVINQQLDKMRINRTFGSTHPYFILLMVHSILKCTVEKKLNQERPRMISFGILLNE